MPVVSVNGLGVSDLAWKFKLLPSKHTETSTWLWWMIRVERKHILIIQVFWDMTPYQRVWFPMYLPLERSRHSRHCTSGPSMTEALDFFETSGTTD